MVIVTPDGRIVALFLRHRFPAQGAQLELEQARAGRVGSPIGRLLLLCYDYDAATGKYTLVDPAADPRAGDGDGRCAGGLPVRDVSPRSQRAPAEAVMARSSRSQRTRQLDRGRRTC